MEQQAAGAREERVKKNTVVRGAILRLGGQVAELSPKKANKADALVPAGLPPNELRAHSAQLQVQLHARDVAQSLTTADTHAFHDFAWQRQASCGAAADRLPSRLHPPSRHCPHPPAIPLAAAIPAPPAIPPPPTTPPPLTTSPLLVFAQQALTARLPRASAPLLARGGHQ